MKRNWLIQLREGKGMNQMQLAELCGVSFQTISNIEVKRRRPSLEVAFKLAEVLSFDVNLFNDVEVEGSESKCG